MCEISDSFELFYYVFVALNISPIVKVGLFKQVKSVNFPLTVVLLLLVKSRVKRDYKAKCFQKYKEGGLSYDNDAMIVYNKVNGSL